MTIPRLNLYTRFFLLFTVTTLLLVVLVVLGSFALSEDEAKDILAERHDALHDMMANLVAGPIDIEMLKEEAKKNRVAIQIQRDSEVWRTGEKLPPPTMLAQNAVTIGQLYFTKVNAQYFIYTTSNNTTIAVTSQIANLIVYPNWLVFWPWLGAICVVFISYRVLTAQLKPINRAIDSATQISQGNLQHRITEHPRNELSHLTHGLNDMAQNLEQLFASKNELLLSVSHELRSPMARMKVLLALLVKSETVYKLGREINTMDEIVEQLLESERMRDSNRLINLETYYFPKVLNEIISGFDGAQNLSLEGAVPEIAIEIDLARFKFVIRNLIENALKHSSGSSPVLVYCQQEKRELIIRIRDFGPGIDAHFLPAIFEPFSQADSVENRSQKGVGLGLFLCKRIALAHGGDLTVESEVSKGSEFTFRLPIMAPAT